MRKYVKLRMVPQLVSGNYGKPHPLPFPQAASRQETRRSSELITTSSLPSQSEKIERLPNSVCPLA
jgi:hypothetical protein